MAILYHIILIILYYVLLGWFKIGYYVLDVYGVGVKFVECRSEEDFILYDRHECWVELVMKHVELLCWKSLGGWEKYLGLTLWYIYLIFCVGGSQ